MDIDATKAPRTHATWKKAYDAQELAKFMVELSVQLEVELNVATVNEVFAENKVHILEKELEKANNRIKRLEEALAEIAYAASHPLGAGQSLTLGKIESIAIKAKEAKA